MGLGVGGGCCNGKRQRKKVEDNGKREYNGTQEAETNSIHTHTLSLPPASLFMRSLARLREHVW